MGFRRIGRIRKVSIFMLIIFTFVVPVSAKPTRPPTPETLKGGTIIDANEAKSLLATTGTKFYDTRSALNCGKGRIKGAVCLPYREKSEYTENYDSSLDQVDLSKLPDNKKTPVVFYSHGNTGWKSYKAANQAMENGHMSVYWLREGYSSWLSNDFPIDQ